MVEPRAKCRNCGAPLDSSHTGPCPNCGEEAGRKVYAGKVKVEGRSTVAFWGRVFELLEFWKVNGTWLIVAVAIFVFSSFVGLLFAGIPGVIISLLIGAVEFWVGPKAITLVRERREKLE
jgi:hypothetical protein